MVMKKRKKRDNCPARFGTGQRTEDVPVLLKKGMHGIQLSVCLNQPAGVGRSALCLLSQGTSAGTCSLRTVPRYPRVLLKSGLVPCHTIRGGQQKAHATRGISCTNGSHTAGEENVEVP